MKYFIDTNIFLRVLIKENKKAFSNCSEFLEKVKTNKIKGVTASLVLVEIAWTLSSYYKFSRKKTAQAVKSVINLRNLKIIDDYDHPLALELFENNKVKFIDACIVSIKEIQLKKWPIVSYDKDFDKLGVKRLEPGQL